MNYKIRSSFLIVLATSFIQVSLAETRVWKSRNGSSVKAEYISQDKKMVSLKKEDGNTISVPIVKLSEEDQKFLTEKLKPVDSINDQYYAMKIVLSSCAKKASFKVLPPWDSHVQVIEKICESNIKAREDGRPPRANVSDWGFEPITYAEVEYILYLSTQPKADFTILVENASFKSYGYNPKTRKSKKIPFSCNQEESTYSIDLKKIKSLCSLIEYAPNK